MSVIEEEEEQNHRASVESEMKIKEGVGYYQVTSSQLMDDSSKPKIQFNHYVTDRITKHGSVTDLQILDVGT
jgi:hypothetical protein